MTCMPRPFANAAKGSHAKESRTQEMDSERVHPRIGVSEVFRPIYTEILQTHLKLLEAYSHAVNSKDFEKHQAAFKALVKKMKLDFETHTGYIRFLEDQLILRATEAEDYVTIRQIMVQGIADFVGAFPTITVCIEVRRPLDSAHFVFPPNVTRVDVVGLGRYLARISAKETEEFKVKAVAMSETERKATKANLLEKLQKRFELREKMAENTIRTCKPYADRAFYVLAISADDWGSVKGKDGTYSVDDKKRKDAVEDIVSMLEGCRLNEALVYVVYNGFPQEREMERIPITRGSGAATKTHVINIIRLASAPGEVLFGASSTGDRRAPQFYNTSVATLQTLRLFRAWEVKYRI